MGLKRVKDGGASSEPLGRRDENVDGRLLLLKLAEEAGDELELGFEATGGLEDTIEDVNAAAGTGTGFKFRTYSGTDMLKAIHRGVSTYSDQATWRKLMKNGMMKDFSWEASARKYVQLYRSITKR